MRRIVLSLISLTLLFAVSSTANYSEGVAAYQAKNYAEAVTQFQAAIEELKRAGAEEDPQYQPYYLMLGNSLSKSGKHKEAIAPLQTALRLKDGDMGTQLTLGQTYYRLEQYSEAAGILGKVDLSSLPKSAQGAISNMLSVCYEKSGNSGLALANMERAAQLNPDDAASQFNYGTKALAAGYTDDAVKALQKAVALEGSDPAKVRAYLNALVLKGRETTNKTSKKAVYEKAVPVATALSKMLPTYDSYLQLAEAQLGAQQYSGAATTLDRTIAKKSSDWLPYFYKGQAYTALNQYSDAVAPLEAALGKRPSANDKVRVDRQLGFVHERLKNLEESMAYYQAANDSAGYRRVEENLKIKQENADVDKHNAEVEELKRQKKELEEKMKALPGAAAPPSNR
jgi:tetratricopeptide (TPR) repeat protein